MTKKKRPATKRASSAAFDTQRVAARTQPKVMYWTGGIIPTETSGEIELMCVNDGPRSNLFPEHRLRLDKSRALLLCKAIYGAFGVQSTVDTRDPWTW